MTSFSIRCILNTASQICFYILFSFLNVLFLSPIKKITRAHIKIEHLPNYVVESESLLLSHLEMTTIKAS